MLAPSKVISGYVAVAQDAARSNSLCGCGLEVPIRDTMFGHCITGLV
jgi:hypothetical protein